MHTKRLFNQKINVATYLKATFCILGSLLIVAPSLAYKKEFADISVIKRLPAETQAFLWLLINEHKAARTRITNIDEFSVLYALDAQFRRNVQELILRSKMPSILIPIETERRLGNMIRINNYFSQIENYNQDDTNISTYPLPAFIYNNYPTSVTSNLEIIAKLRKHFKNTMNFTKPLLLTSGVRVTLSPSAAKEISRRIKEYYRAHKSHVLGSKHIAQQNYDAVGNYILPIGPMKLGE